MLKSIITWVRGGGGGRSVQSNQTPISMKTYLVIYDEKRPQDHSAHVENDEKICFHPHF